MTVYEKLNAVHLDDLERLLIGCGIYDDYKSGLVKCKFCKKVITKDNIYSLFRDSGSYKLICDNSECVKSLLELINDRKKKRLTNE